MQAKKDGRVNIRDVATKAGVSTATVSRYINDGVVSDATRERVESAIRETGYVPNICARGVFGNKYKTIGFMVSNINNPFFTQLASEIEKYAFQHGYAMYLCSTDDDVAKERYYIDRLEGYRVDGVITSRTMCKDEYRRWGIPVVSFENEISDDVFSVSTNNYAGGRMAARHLIERGCRRLLHVTGPTRFEAVLQRRDGFLTACAEAGLKAATVKLDYDIQFDAAKYEVLHEVDWRQYDGVFIFNDITAVMVVKEIQRRGRAIPDEIKVVGYDNSFISAVITPSLTTLEQPFQDIAATLVGHLIQMIDGHELTDRRKVFEPRLIERASTGAAAG